MYKKTFVFIIFCFLSLPVKAEDDCLAYKLKPSVYLETPSWSKEVVQPLEEMDFYHGNVVATMVDNYDITADITSIEDGFCVSLKSVDALVGYTDFLVNIDIRHVPNSCSYNAVLGHEDEHIRAYLSVIDDNKKELKDAIYKAADSIMPIFVREQSSIESAIDTLNYELQSHPDLILIKQKLKASEEINNKKIDQLETGEALKKCFE